MPLFVGPGVRPGNAKGYYVDHRDTIGYSLKDDQES